MQGSSASCHPNNGRQENGSSRRQMAVLNKGRIEHAGTVKQVFSRPATEFVARFLATCPRN